MWRLAIYPLNYSAPSPPDPVLCEKCGPRWAAWDGKRVVVAYRSEPDGSRCWVCRERCYE